MKKDEIMYDEKFFNYAEGIDTISVQVKNSCVNKAFLWNKTRISEGISLRKSEDRFYCDIQFEALDMRQNLRLQISQIVLHLYVGNYIILGIPEHTPLNAVEYFLIEHLDDFVILSELDFFFDFAETDVKKFVIYGNYQNGNYSLDHRDRKSLWLIYDRRPRLYKVNQIAHEVIDRMPFPIRVEMRLSRSNCDYLDFSNLDGNYYEIIFFRFLHFIAKSWRRYNAQLGTAAFSTYHYAFNQVMLVSNSGAISSLPELKKSPPRYDKNITPLIMREEIYYSWVEHCCDI